MIERFTVRSFEKMDHHPDQNMDLVDEEYFNTIEACKKWCKEQFEIKTLNFEIHHSIGARTYLFAMGTGTGIMNWIEKEYDQSKLPSLTPWWSINEVPEAVNEFCQDEEF